MIWRDGVLPPGSPDFSQTLTVDLLDQGYGLLALALRARRFGDRSAETTRGLVVAAESIESAVRKGSHADVDRGFHLFVAASAFHLAQYAARSFCLLRPNSETDRLNLSTAEQCVAALLQGQRRRMRHLCVSWLDNPDNSDAGVARRLVEAEAFEIEDAERVALTATVLRALGLYDGALSRGDHELVDVARERLALTAQLSQDRGYVPLWWTSELTLEIAENIWESSLHVVLPPDIEAAEREERDRWRVLRTRYINVLLGRANTEIQLWPSQIEAAKRVADSGDDLVVALPTSAGKTRIAELCILRCLAARKRVVYVTPLRALSAQVERSLAKVFVPLGFSVTALYGASGVALADIGTLRSAEIVVATPEKLDFAIRQEPDVLNDVGLIVLDEGHMIGPGTRELRYEVLVQRLLRRSDASGRRLVCLSAVFTEGEAFSDFTRWLRSDEPGGPVTSEWRPMRQRVGVIQWRGTRGHLSLLVDEETPYVPSFIPLEAPQGKRRRNAFPQNDEELVLASAKAFLADGQRVLIYCPLRGSVENLGELVLRLARQGYLANFLPSDVSVARAIAVGTEWLGANHVAVECLKIGVALHHGSMPRAFLSEIEDLISQRRLRLTISSPTLAQGIDLSASVLIFRSIYRGRNPIPPEEYANVVGRAGRAFVDLDGITVYPIFDSGNAARGRLNAFTQLRRDAQSREMESGIVLLIRELVELITRYTGATPVEIIEYVTNTSGPWTIDNLLDGRARTSSPELGEPDPDLYFASRLAELDTAILGSIDDPTTEVTLVAEALDAALRTSYWSRRLARLTPEDSALQRSILAGRARWMWSRSTPDQRRGFYAAGVGFDAGVALLANVVPLTAAIIRAEIFLEAGDLAAAAEATSQVATTLFAIGPFQPDSLPPNWQALLARWISGAELPEIMTDVSEDISFIQTGIVYHLVWAVEAVRSQALAVDVEGAPAITGSLALALSYGVPSYAGAVMAQAGLHSRRMLMRLLQAFPADFVEIAGMREWLRPIVDSEKGDALWTSEGELSLWRDFSRWASDRSGQWQETVQSVAAEWAAAAPPDGTRVRILHDNRTGTTSVYEFTLNRIGQLRAPIPDIEESEVTASVVENGTQVQLRRFSGSA